MCRREIWGIAILCFDPDQKYHNEVIMIQSILLLALVFGFCSASLPEICFTRRPFNTHPCNKTLQVRRFFFSSDANAQRYRCKPFGICRDIAVDKDQIAGSINYFLSLNDCKRMCTKAVECPELSIDNGLVTQNSLRRYVGYTARYSCNGGYKLVGATSRTCLPSGNWSDEAPTCEVQCTPPPVVANCSTIEPVQEYYDVGSTVTYACRCEQGFSGGEERVECLNNGQWSAGNQISCTEEGSTCMPIEKPRIFNMSSDEEVSQEKTLTLTCLISGCPSPEFRWYHNGVLMNKSDRVEMTFDPRFDELTVCILTIKGVVPEDKGDYVCEANNSAGSASMHIASVTVTPSPVTVKRSTLKRYLRAKRPALNLKPGYYV